ncbi:hypothetical protein, partial [Pseudomonas viridiflava]|nr:hypothetical protein [Pseudomonas viridiflava]
RAPTKNRVPSVVYGLFDKRRLAGDAVEAVRQVYRVIVHRRQAASHSPNQHDAANYCSPTPT